MPERDRSGAMLVPDGHRGTRAIQRMVEFAPSTGGLALWVRHQDLPEVADAAADPTAAAAAAGTTAGGAAAAVVATDGNTIFYHPRFAELSLAAQVGLVAHEVLHIALRHPQRCRDLQHLVGDVDLQLFTVCADAIVNSTLGHLNWLQLPAGAVTLERLLASALGIELGVENALLQWDVERLYRAIDDRGTVPSNSWRQPRSRSGGGAAAGEPESGQGARGPATRESSSGVAQAGTRGPPQAAPRAGAHERSDAQAADGARADGPRAARARALGAASHADLLPGADAQGPPEAEAEQARAWSERIVRAHAGDGEFSMLRALIADLPRTRTPWAQVLRTQLNRSLSARPALSWSRPTRSYLANQGRCGPHRRMPWEPGSGPSRAVPRLVVIVDVSGSIEDDLMGRFAGEIEAITRRLEAGLVLVIGDERVRQVTEFEPGRSDLRGIAFHGGGGTDFTPLLEEADRHRPDITVVLTDLEGPARFRPRWPVIWAVPQSHATAVPPFGRKLVLN